jgi:CheY-like chemotaxis protein/signal transduction histidine kinase
MSKQPKFLRSFAFDQKDQRLRQSLIVRMAGLGSLNYLTGYFFLVEQSDITICLLGFAACLLLASVAHFFGALDGAAHGFIVLSFLALAVLISRTGGINSPVLVWIPTIAIAALLLINLRWSVAWLFILLLHNIGQYMAGQYLLINADVGVQTVSPIVTLLTKLNVAIVLIFVLYWYEIRYREKNARLSARTLALTELQANLQKTRDQIDFFVNALESQLRLPMQRARLMAPITQLELPLESPTEGAVDVVVQASNQLIDLVDELGELAKLESGQMVFTQSAFDVREALSTAVVAFSAHKPATKVSIQWATANELHAWALGDKTRLSRAVAGLFAHCAKYDSLEGLQVHAAFDGRLLTIDIPQQQTPEAPSIILDAPLENADLAQSSQTTKSEEIQAQNIHERLIALAGGQIAYVQKPQGVVLRLEWPMLATPEPPFSKQAPKGEVAQSLRVMLVGSQGTQQFEMQQALRQLFGSCEFGVADSAETAMVQLAFGSFDLVLVELQLPGLDGIDLTRRIRNHEKPHVRDLLVVGIGSATLAPQCQSYLDAGMHWLLFRPWTMDTLFRALKAQLL